MALQKRRQVARDGRVCRVGQAQLNQTGAAALWADISGFLRHKTIEHQALNFIARQRNGARAANQLRAAAQQGDVGLRRRVGTQQQFFGGAAALHQLREARCRQTGSIAQAALNVVRQRQVHVVAAEHQMFADADARQTRQAIGGGRSVLDRNQRQVRGAAADVAHQHLLRAVQLRGQLLALAKQPVVEGGLRFFQQAQRGQAGIARGLQRQGARAFVERGWHRQHDVLLRQRRIGKARIPRRMHMRQIAGAGRDRRDFGYVTFRALCAPRQDGGVAVNAGVRQPAFGAADQARRHLAAQVACVTPQHRCFGAVPRQGQLRGA